MVEVDSQHETQTQLSSADVLGKLEGTLPVGCQNQSNRLSIVICTTRLTGATHVTQV